MIDAVLALRSSGLEDPKVHEASEVCWVACFQLGRQPEFDDVEKKLSLLGRALEFCPPDKLHDVLGAWQRLEKELEGIENRRYHIVVMIRPLGILHRLVGKSFARFPHVDVPIAQDP